MSSFVKIDRDKAKETLNRVLFKTFFHEMGWHDFLEKEFKWLKFEYYLYKDNFLLPVAKVNKKLISLPFCEYGGPLPLKRGIDFTDFEKDVLKEFSNNIKIKVHPLMLETKSPTLTPSVSTHWIDLKNKTEKDLFKSFRKTLRHSIKKAQNKGLKIKKCSNEVELKQFYNLYVANLKRKKTVPYPFSIFKFLYNQPETEILLAFYKNKIIAGDLFLHYDPPAGEASEFVHYFLSAANYKYHNLGASHLILWEKIKSLIAYRPEASAYRGQDLIFDLGAAPRGSQLQTFKKGWRGKEYPILQIGIKRDEEFLRSSKLVRVIWGLLPIFIIKIISRYFIKYRI